MVLPVGRLHQLAAEIVIDRRKSARVGMAPGIALDGGQALCGEPSRDRIHADVGMNERMGRVLQDHLAPTVDRQWPLYKAIAEAGRLLGRGIFLDPGVITDDLKPPAVDLAEPTADRNFPNRMLPEEPADNAESYALVGPWRGGESSRGVPLGHDPAHERAVNAREI